MGKGIGINFHTKRIHELDIISDKIYGCSRSGLNDGMQDGHTDGRTEAGSDRLKIVYSFVENTKT